MFNLKGKVALVTGVGSPEGIGFASAKLLAKAGAKLFITSTTKRILEREKELKSLFGNDNISSLEADLTVENQVSNLSKIVIKKFNQIDILVNNAGMVQIGNDQPTKKFIEFHGLADAKIAHRQYYPTHGNWKLTLDNFHECYHCHPSHPEYCQVHDKEYIIAYGAGSNTGPASDKFDKVLSEWNEKVNKMGHLTGEYSETEFNDYSRSAERTPLKEGMFTETKSGQPISKLMGKFTDYDCGYTSVGTSPFNSLLMCNDFATLFTFIPVSPLYTQVELMWLVHKDAEEGIDYNLDEMKWMWDVTTVADKRIIEDNQKGVLSEKYLPGPLSEMEKGLEKFKSWYLKHLENSIT